MEPVLPIQQKNHQQLQMEEAVENIWKILATVPDPEVPVLSVLDLGIIRKVAYSKEVSKWIITITPTYTGCPAMDAIASNIRFTLFANNIKNIEIVSVLSPAWTTDWMSEEGKRKLKDYGIAPPNKQMEIPEDGVECPLCKSHDTKLISTFGSTACKALYQCKDCKEPFDYFKCH